MAGLIGIDPLPLRHWAIAFLAPFILLLPATAAMGATLPAAERLSAVTLRNPDAIGGLYAVNTFGAVAGIGLTTFLVVPAWGYGVTGVMLAACNIGCALGALLLTVQRGSVAAQGPAGPAISDELSSWRLAVVLFGTGLLGIGYEVIVVRVLSQILENTVYSFASVLVIFLLGTAAGAALYQLGAPRERFRGPLAWLLVGTSTACLLGIYVLWSSAPLYAWIREVAGAGLGGALTAELGVAASVLLLPTLMMGATFAHLARAATRNDLGLGRALAVNTLGGAIAPAVFGIALLPAIGSTAALTGAAIGYAAFVPPPRRARGWMPLAVPVTLAGLALLWLTPADLVDLGPDERILAHTEGVMAAVTVVEDGHKERHLRVNSRFQMGGTSTLYSDQREAHLPLLLHPDPKTALFLGIGTGMTFAAAARHPTLRAEGVELVPEIVELMDYFEPAVPGWGGDRRLSVRVADARRYIQASPDHFDVIVADLFHPSRDGAGSLYTLEHFEAIRARLAAGGLFMQWLPLYQLDLDTLRVITKTYLQVFPDARAFLAHYSLKAPIIGLLGGAGSSRYAAGWLERRVRDPVLARELTALRLGSDYELFGGLLADGSELMAFADDAPLNTDDHPVVTFEAPRFAYGDPGPAHERLLTLLDAFSVPADSILEADASVDGERAQRRLAAFFEARDRFIRAGVGMEQTDDVRRLDRELREPLLAVVRASPDFSAAYNPLLAMAQCLHRIDPAAAGSLLRDLELANPLRQEAGQLRRRLNLN